MKKIVLLALVLVLSSTSMFAALTKPVEASETVYIRSNGLIEGTDKITSGDNVTYRFLDDINGRVIVERSNIVIDGNGHTLQGAVGIIIGFNLTSVSNVTITKTNIDGFGNSPGIVLSHASNNIISRNNITCVYGVSVSSSVNNSIYENNIKQSPPRHFTVGISLSSSNSNKIYANELQLNEYGIRFQSSGSNAVFGNTIAGNDYGVSLSSSSNNSIYGNYVGTNYNYNIGLWSSSGNTFYHNNVVGGPIGVIGPSVALNNSTNTWHDGYPSGGNYWGTGFITTDVDVKSGPFQNQTGSDAIVDTPHVLDANNTDSYPLMGVFSDFEATPEHHVQTISNSTILDFHFNGTAISFSVDAGDGTLGFCRVLIPTALIGTPYKVYVNGTQIGYTLFSPSNSTDNYLYFTYTHSTQEVVIMRKSSAPPTYLTPTSMIVLIVLTAAIVLTAVIVIYRRRLFKPSEKETPIVHNPEVECSRRISFSSTPVGTEGSVIDKNLASFAFIFDLNRFLGMNLDL